MLASTFSRLFRLKQFACYRPTNASRHCDSTRGQTRQHSNVAMASSSKGDFIVASKYRLIRKIGSGSFGDIYLGINITNGEVSLCYNLLYKQVARLHTGSRRQTRADARSSSAAVVREQSVQDTAGRRRHSTHSVSPSFVLLATQ